MTAPRRIDPASLTIMLGLSGGLLAGCEPAPSATGEWQVCTDNLGRRIADAGCQPGGTYRAGYGGAHWVYLPRTMRVPPLGEAVLGGSRTSAGTLRGGFGGTAASTQGVSGAHGDSGAHGAAGVRGFFGRAFGG